MLSMFIWNIATKRWGTWENVCLCVCTHSLMFACARATPLREHNGGIWWNEIVCTLCLVRLCILTPDVAFSSILIASPIESEYQCILLCSRPPCYRHLHFPRGTPVPKLGGSIYPTTTTWGMCWNQQGGQCREVRSTIDGSVVSVRWVLHFGSWSEGVQALSCHIIVILFCNNVHAGSVTKPTFYVQGWTSVCSFVSTKLIKSLLLPSPFYLSSSCQRIPKGHCTKLWYWIDVLTLDGICEHNIKTWQISRFRELFQNSVFSVS